MGYVLGIDVGGTNTRLGLVDEAGKLSHFYRISTEEYNKDGEALTLFIGIVAQYIQRVAEEVHLDAISVGFPSTIDKARKTVIETPNIEGLNNIPVVNCLKEQFGIPVFLERDTCLLLINDMEKNHIPTEGVAIGIYYGTGIGNGISIDGKIFTGKHGVSAELGHIPMRGVKGHCGCGNEACAEIIACGRALEKLVAECFPETMIEDVFKKHANSEIMHQFIDDLALPAAIEINILDPDYIIIGGGLPNMIGFPKAEFEANIHKYVRKPLPARDLQLIYSNEGQESGVRGAAIHARRALLEAYK